MNNDANVKIKQQIVDKIKSSTNILVTVSRDPNVDDLSAAVGFTAMLNNMGKHATAIFSGTIPPAISFLEPDKIFEGTADSLRDFIIALDKEKADHLRYKIEGDVVKIFITPYRTTITGEDLQFSQGDFNVELVLALGVTDQQHLDNAISAHSQIIEDVTIATFSSGENVSNLGTLGWHDDQASSLCEMVTAISESLKVDKPLLDKQISTALLTGIVFATDRFSNPRTTSKVMTMAAQLMAAGADQQLIAAKLNDDHIINSSTMSPSIKNMSESDGALDVPMESNPVVSESAPAASDAGTLKVSHTEPESEPEIPATSTLPPSADIPAADNKIVSSSESTLPDVAQPPSMGGTLNATTDQAAEDNRRELEDQKNTTILSHSYLAGSEPNVGASINSVGQESTEGQNVDIFAAAPPVEGEPNPDGVDTNAPIAASVNPPDQSMSTLPPMQSPAPSPAPAAAERDSDEAKMAVESAFGTELPVQPAGSADIGQEDLGLPMPPPLPDFSTLPPQPQPSQPSPFDFAATSLASSPGAIAAQPVMDDPSQFKIPG